jgi:exosome complex component CSL4
MVDKRLVLPGEELGTTEEFLPGLGTYEEGGKIYAAVTGLLDIDTKEMATRVRPMNPPVKLKVGDAVIGTVDDIRSSMVQVELIKVAGKDRAIADQGVGSIHVSHISDSYVQDTESQFHLLDVVRARVIQTQPSIQLSTAGQDFGVIKALCSRCRQPMQLRGNELYCAADKHSETRKLAQSYGSADFWKAPTAEEVARAQEHYAGEAARRAGRERRGGGRGGPWRGGGGRRDSRGGRGPDRGRGRDDRGRGRRPPQERQGGS